MHGNRVEPADRAVARYILHRRIWRGWRLALLIVATPSSVWLLFRQVSNGFSARTWPGVVLWGILFIVVLVVIRRQVYLRRWKRNHDTK